MPTHPAPRSLRAVPPALFLRHAQVFVALQNQKQLYSPT